MDAIQRLQQKIDSGEVELDYDSQHGYVLSVLKALDVPLSSQGLVFSKTSFQAPLISPQKPRAVYFNDDVYVGFVQYGSAVEISAVDPNLGATFYVLDQKQVKKPQFVRKTDECLQCHGTSLTRGVPGHVVRSVFTGADGHPILSAGTFRTTHDSPLEERWGGWYVSGMHGWHKHMGNVTATRTETGADMDRMQGANITDLNDVVNVKPYPTPHSDIVALMVLEHQVQLHNLMTAAVFQTRQALHDQKVLDGILERKTEGLSESTQRRIKAPAERMLRYMLFVDEAPLKNRISGTSGFKEEFVRRGPHDSKGRSLRQLDVRRQLFKYPCSYLIYSDQALGFPDELKNYVYDRLYEVLSGKDSGEPWEYLDLDACAEVIEILKETHPDLSKRWK
jgi:hypothetical protein